MPIIIYGSRGNVTELSSGDFRCPHCQNIASYSLKEAQRYFTLFFIPLFPTDSGIRFVECGHCGSQFEPDVLEHQQEVPSESLLMMAASEQLKDGRSVETILDRLASRGVERDEIETLLLKLCEGQAWLCDCGHRYHPSVRRCAGCGKELPPQYDSPRAREANQQLRAGLSLEEVREKLAGMGESPDESEALLLKLCEGQAWRCDCGRRYHPRVTRCLNCGKEL